MKLFVGVLLATLSSGFIILSFPPHNLEILAWISLVPLLVAIRNRGPMAAFGLSFLTGITSIMGIFYWINVVAGVGVLDFLILVIYFGSYYGLFGLLLNRFSGEGGSPRILVAPALWVALEYVRGQAGFMALPWALLGHSQYLALPVIQVASFTGVYGVSFLIVLANVAIADGIRTVLYDRIAGPDWRPWCRRTVPVTVALLLSSIGYGYYRVSGERSRETIEVTAIQGNVPQEIKWTPAFRQAILEKHLNLTKAAAAETGSSLVVWPESAVPGFLSQDPHLLRTISRLVRVTGTPLILGCAQRPKFKAGERGLIRLNSAFLISPGGEVPKRYDKIRLLPFAEYLPWRDIIPWPSRFASAAGNFIPGGTRTLFEAEGNRFGVLICWENIFPDLFRAFVKDGAHFMVNITNEAWFGDTAAPEQFLMQSVFRSVETRRAVVRAANTGISCFIGPHGDILGKVTVGGRSTFVEGYRTIGVPLEREMTIYTIYGDFFAFGCILLAVGLGVRRGFRAGKCCVCRGDSGESP